MTARVRPTLSNPRYVDVLGVAISDITMDTAVDTVESWVVRGRREFVCAVDVNSLMNAYWDGGVRNVLNDAGLATPDGVPLVWAGRYAGSETIGRVPGPDLMPALCGRAAERGWRVFFLGGEEGVPERVAALMGEQAPGLTVAGCYSPPFRPLSLEEDRELVEMINRSGADIVFVAFGAPRQEMWMAEHRDILDAAVLVGVGAAFAMHAGTVSRAPGWLQNSGMEWTYRLAKEPRRLGRRYFKSHPAFIKAVMLNPPRLVA